MKKSYVLPLKQKCQTCDTPLVTDGIIVWCQQCKTQQGHYNYKDHFPRYDAGDFADCEMEADVVYAVLTFKVNSITIAGAQKVAKENHKFTVTDYVAGLDPTKPVSRETALEMYSMLQDELTEIAHEFEVRQ